MRKHIFLSLLLILLGGHIIAQTEFEAAKLNNPEISGSARYSALAGAYGALGGDASAIKDNPAGLGVYRSSEIGFTGGLIINNNSSVWNNKNSSNNSFKANFNNFSYVWNVPIYGKETGLLYSNIAFTFNKVKNFRQEMNIEGAGAKFSLTDVMADITNGVNPGAMSYKNNNNPYKYDDLGWLSVLGYQAFLIDTIKGTGNKYKSIFGNKEAVEPSAYVLESGGINEYGFSWGGNFSNKFFLGASLNMVTLNYHYSSEYKEKVGTTNEAFTINNYINKAATGVNFKTGIIYLPTNSLRLGLAVHTPTAYTISVNHDASIISTYKTDGMERTPLGTDEYNYVGPWQIQVSAAYMFGKKGLIAFEYDHVTNTTSKYTTKDGKSSAFNYENKAIKSDLKNNNVFKIGAEYKVTENIALRGGYANVNGINPTSTEGKIIYDNSTYTNTEYFQNKGSQFYTLGLGYREASWFLDIGYVLKREKSDFYNFDYNYFGKDSILPASITSNTHNIVATVGFKF